jgi:large exoprotein involved in heme utilization and adhesion
MNGGRLYANGGRVEIGGLAAQGTVGLNFTDNNLSLSFPDRVTRAEVYLTNNAGVNVRAGGGGSIAINAHNLNIERDTRLLAGIDEGLGSINSIAGDIDINATGTINLNDSFLSSQVQPGAVGNGGNINITAGSLSVTNGAVLAASTFGQGDAGSVNINARDSVSFDGLRSGGLISQAISAVSSRAVGKGGDINITTGSLSVTNGAFLSATTFGRGDAGNVNINARDTVFFDGVSSNGLPSAAESLVGSSAAVENGEVFDPVDNGDVIKAVGNGGDINITTGSLFLTNGAQLVTTTLGQGNAGSVNINARDTVSFDGITSNGYFLSAAFSSVGKTGQGNGGDIRITTGELSLTNGGVLTAYTEGQGNAGSVIVNARNRVSFDGTTSVGGFVTSSAAFSSVEQTGRGNGGDIRITTGELSLTNGGSLKANTEGQGDAGSVIIDARDTVSLQGVKDKFSSAILTSTESEVGESNKIIVSTSSFRLADGAIIDARTYSSRPGGSVTINANNFEATNGGQVITSTYSSGQAGNITLNVTKSTTLSSSDPTYADRLARFGNRVGNVGAESGLFASTNPGAEGNGGDIFVNSRTLNIQDSAKIAVNSQGTGSGGNIEIQAGNLTLNSQALISAETFSSQGGNIKLGLQDILLLRRGSQISTNAGTQGAGGNGGNITINDPGNPRGFVVAASRENNDITANAFSGSGGRVTINATRYFWYDSAYS